MFDDKMGMNKRGQVSVFAIIGIVLLVVIALIFLLRSEVGLFVPPQTFLGEKLTPIEQEVRRCVSEVVEPGVLLMGKQGGDLTPVNYVRYQDSKVKFFCANIPEKEECMNVMPTLDSIEKDFHDYLQFSLEGCINKDILKPGLGYEISVGDLKTEIDFGMTTVQVVVDYDVEVSKGETRVSLRKIPVVIRDVPFAELYGVANDVVNRYSVLGAFDQFVYMIEKKGKYEIKVDKPYPHIVFMVNKKDSDYEFWFAIEGEETFVI